MASTLQHFVCVGCERSIPPAGATRCPECAGSLYGQYDWPADGDNGAFSDRSDIWRYETVLPGEVTAGLDPTSIGEGGAPLIGCPGLAKTAGVGELIIQDDGRSTTASGLADRGASLVATAVRERGIHDPVVASSGASAVALAAYVAGGKGALTSGTQPTGTSNDQSPNAGGDQSSSHDGDPGTPGDSDLPRDTDPNRQVDDDTAPGSTVHAFVPARSPFAHKALYNVHGGDMRVVGGRYDDAVAALTDARAADTDPAADWTPVGPGAMPHWVEGAKTAALEALERTETTPDAVVSPVGHGVAVAGWWRGIAALAEADRIDHEPRLFAVQAGGCAPIVEAVESEEPAVSPVETPDTVSASLEIPNPAVGDLALRAIAETAGGAVAVTDESLLEAGVQVSRNAGLEVGSPGAAALAGVSRLVERGALGADDRVLVYNPSTATPEADLFRSHLMRRGE